MFYFDCNVIIVCYFVVFRVEDDEKQDGFMDYRKVFNDDIEEFLLQEFMDDFKF